MERLVFVAVGATALLLVFWARLFQLQVIDGERYAAVVEQAQVSIETLPPRRGRILDRQGAAMAETRPIYHLSVVFADLELTGRARRDLPLLRLDGRAFDALAAELTTRLRWIGREPGLREVLTRELLTYPGVAVRTGKPGPSEPLALVALARSALVPVGESEEGDDARRLVESDLLSEDPRDALAREMKANWGIAAEIVDDAAFAAACAQLDLDFGNADEPSASILAPFADRFVLRAPAVAGQPPAEWPAYPVRILSAERRARAEESLARVIGESLPLVRERLARALAVARHQAPAVVAPGERLYFGAAGEAEQIAPFLPGEAKLVDIPVPEVPGAQERVWILQGDPPDGEGLFARLCRRLAATFGCDWQFIQAAIEAHAETIKASTSDRRYATRHLVLDLDRLDRLEDSLFKAIEACQRKASVLEIDAELARVRRSVELQRAGRTRNDPVPLMREIPHEVAVRMAGRSAGPPDDLRRAYLGTEASAPGLRVVGDIGRSYPFPGSAPHLIGMLSRADETDLPGQLKGTTGLEARYDERLRGVPGLRVRARTPDGFQMLRESPALAGEDLKTELDLELQLVAEDSLVRYIELAAALGSTTQRMEKAAQVGKGRAGFALIDCHSGAILALASTPTFDLETSRTRWNELLKDPAGPLHDYAAEAIAPPGSSFKILTALAALENKVATPGEQIYCQGFMTRVGGKTVLRDHAPAGTYDLAEAIQMSSNVYFAILADRLAKRWGPELLPTYAERVGLGRNNALDVWSQRPGRLPKPSNLRKDRPAEPRWYPSDSWRMGIGQFADASPLQCVAIAAAVANGGHVVRPFLVRPEGGPEVSDLHVPAAYLEDVRHGMERVTANLDHATARTLVLSGAATGIKVAAKTGTAEWGSAASRERGATPDHAWLIGYAPADAPTVAFAVFIHSGTYGGQACVPVAKRVLEMYFSKYGKDGHAQAK